MKFLVIQTAFIGDVILATSVPEKLHEVYPGAKIDILVRKGNETLFTEHPFLNSVLVWDKKAGKYSDLFRLLKIIRKTNYDHVINLHRYASSGLLTAFSGSKSRIGFDKNPFSFRLTKKVKHVIGNGTPSSVKTAEGKHETERNHELIRDITDAKPVKPKLYPTKTDRNTIADLLKDHAPSKKYVCMAPASVWFTKQLPKEKWMELIKEMNKKNYTVFFLGAESDKKLMDDILSGSENGKAVNLAGKLSLLASAALMSGAQMNYVNDSAPMHLASAMNAPVTAFFCSTIPAFGFGPLSQRSVIAQTKEKLECRPCGIHGKKHCPEQHFSCAMQIDVKLYTGI